MPLKSRNHILDSLTATLLLESGSVGLFHYNKLAYLSEFLFIKNFGARYTGELFLKLPHGPVIAGYKKQIMRLSKDGVLVVDLDKLNSKRTLKEDDYNLPVKIRATDGTKEISVKERIIRDFIKQVVQKYGELSTTDIERAVYNTEPVKKYLQLAASGFRKQIGGYILKSDCIRIKDYKDAQSEGRLTYLQHICKHPTVSPDIQRKVASEFDDLNGLRPRYNYHEE